MNKYNSLLIRIATELGIHKGATESEVNYKSRLIYSAVSRIGYASLWDKLEDNVPVSIEHFKRRVENTLNSYLKIYPEVQGIFPDDKKLISESMYNTLLATGNLYHSPKRISPPMRVQAGYDKIVFLRGTSLSEKISISGIGTYAKSPENCGNTSVQDMFGLTKNTIVDYWRHYSEMANWTNMKSDEKYEFLNIKLGIGRERVQFILTTASMPYGTDDEKNAVMTFARELTSSSIDAEFVFLRGEREVIEGMQKYDIPIAKFKNVSISDIEENENARLEALNSFWDSVEGAPKTFDSVDEACVWMYNNIIHYRPFFELIRLCRENAVSLGELAKEIFPNTDEDDALNAVSVLLAIAPLARKNNMVLFPARMHMLFRGIKGVYACANKLCSHSHSHKSLSLGEIFMNDGHMTCPECGSVVYELYNDRRCGSLFYKGYILDDEIGTSGFAYLWHYPGQLLDKNLKEIHLYIPPDDYEYQKRGKYPLEICYLDIKSEPMKKSL